MVRSVKWNIDACDIAQYGQLTGNAARGPAISAVCDGERTYVAKKFLKLFISSTQIMAGLEVIPMVTLLGNHCWIQDTKLFSLAQPAISNFKTRECLCNIEKLNWKRWRPNLYVIIVSQSYSFKYKGPTLPHWSNEISNILQSKTWRLI